MFYDVLQVPAVSRKTPRGTGEEILEKMGHPLGKLILEYRGIAKLLNTYIDKMPEILNKKTGRIHCSYNSYGADTGRFSSNSPNLQNIPSRGEGGEIRKIFVATKEIKEDIKDNKLDLLIQDEVQTLTGWKNVEELTVNDIIICDDGNHKINNVQINGKQVLIEIE